MMLIKKIHISVNKNKCMNKKIFILIITKLNKKDFENCPLPIHEHADRLYPENKCSWKSGTKSKTKQALTIVNQIR